MRLLYSFLWVFILPLAVIRLVILSFKNPQYLERIQERFGFIPRLEKNDHLKTIWIHAVSVGEVQATQPLVSALKAIDLEVSVIITTGTPTGCETVKKLYQNEVQHFYLPYDVSFFIHRFLKQSQADMVLLMETELWPNLIHACHQKSVPVCLVNGRLSERSRLRYSRFPGLVKAMLQELDQLMVQSQADLERLVNLGAPAEKIHITGSLKFDLTVDEGVQGKAEQIKSALFPSRPIWLAASTHAGEEEKMVAVHQMLLKQIPNCLLILAPRHPVRSSEVMKILSNSDLSFTLRSSVDIEAHDVQLQHNVFVLDTLGELLQFFAVSDMAFIAGSLVPHGGHNPLEAAALAKPVLIGPHDFNFKEISNRLVEKGGAIRVDNQKGLESKLIHLFQNPAEAESMGENALAFIRENQGATAKVLNVLQSYIN